MKGKVKTEITKTGKRRKEGKEKGIEGKLQKEKKNG